MYLRYYESSCYWLVVYYMYEFVNRGVGRFRTELVCDELPPVGHFAATLAMIDRDGRHVK